MKYVEQIKSAVLLFLVLLSICLTVMIWTYKPVYPTIEENNNSVKEISIGEKRELKDVLKPYRILARKEDQLLGTVSSKLMDEVVLMMQQWEIENFMLINNDISEEEINAHLRDNNRVMLMYSTPIPLNQFSNVLRFAEQDLPQAAFNRIVLDWSNLETTKSVQIFFLNTENETAYRANAPVPQYFSLKRNLNEMFKNYIAYEEVEREKALSLYVTTGIIESIEYEYYINELPIELFKNMLFPGTPVLERNIESDNIEKYTDGMALMTLDKYSKIINYAYPAVEGGEDISPGKLLRNSFDFINEHGGFTADYRFSAMNADRKITEYQLFVQGYPVYSGNIATRIVTTWGEDRIFSYRRPYYSLDIGGQTIKQLPTSDQVLQYIKNKEDINFNEIDELIIGYYLTQNEERRLFKLEPCWFVVEGNSRYRILPEDLGGVANGLE